MSNRTRRSAGHERARSLTARQRSYLGSLAKQAHAKLTSAGAIDEPETEWRHAQARTATRWSGCPEGVTISEASRADFDNLEQHFLALAGRTKEAFDRASGPDNATRQMAHNIGVAMRTAGVTEAYVAGICRRMFGRADWRGPEGTAVLSALNKHARRAKATPTPTTAIP